MKKIVALLLSIMMLALAAAPALADEPYEVSIQFVGLFEENKNIANVEAELNKITLNINLDMIGTYMGHFIARVSAEDALVNYIKYLGAELGFGIAPRQGVYSSDSTPFADKGVPALSFARIAGPSQAVIHNRYDTPDVLSDDRIRTDSIFITAFTRRMANAVKCPVKREIPEKVKNELDEYLFRKRKDN